MNDDDIKKLKLFAAAVAAPRLPYIQPITTVLDHITLHNNVEAPIERAAHIQEMLRGLKRDLRMYERLVRDTQSLITDYEILAGVPI